MHDAKTLPCTVCGDERRNSNRWFLLVENRREDKIKILQWNDRLAAQAGIHRACSAAHVQELVVHWMTTGSLDYPFAEVAFSRRPRRRWSDTAPPAQNVEGPGARPVGELAVHRESVKRVLHDSPHSLNTILEALLRALDRENAVEPRPDPSSEELSLATWHS